MKRSNPQSQSSSTSDEVTQPDSAAGSDDSSSDNDSGANIVTQHRANLLKIYSDTEVKDPSESVRHLVPEPPSPTTLRRWNAPTKTSKAAGLGTIHEEGNGARFNESENEQPARPMGESASAGPEWWADQVKTSIFCGCGNNSDGDKKTPKEWLETLLPMTAWLSTYKWREYLQTDVLAGLTVGVMIVPQSMSYAKLAGLPVQFGLYSSLVPIYAYAFFGSSRQLAVGPVAMVSLLLSTGLTMILEKEGITKESTSEAEYEQIYTTLALQTSVLVGICYIVMGVLRLGFVTIFLSHAVVSGFTSAAAIIIGLSQVKYIFGYDIPNDKSLHGILKNIFANIEKFNWKTFLLGTSCVFTLMGLKKVAQKYPRLKWTRAAGPLLVTVVCIVLQATIDLEARGIPIVGYIPAGLPSFTGDIVFPVTNMGNLAIVVLSIVIVGFMESIAIAKKLAQTHGYELDSSLELVGLGMANLTSGLFGGYPVTGSFSRSAVNNASGAHSGLSAMVTATMVAITLLCLTSVFELLALAALASIVISGVISLVDCSEAIYLWRVHKFDFCVWMAAFIGTLFLGVELGLGISVGISLLLVLFESAYPHTAVLGRLPGTHQYRNIKQYPDAEEYDGILLARVDAPIYFANTQHVRDKIHKYYQRAEERLREEGGNNDVYDKDEEGNGKDEQQPLNTPDREVKRIQFIILELNPVSHIDTSAVHTLQEMSSSFRKEKDIRLCLTNPNPRVMQRLVQSGLADEIGRERIFVSLHDAVHYCLEQMDTQEMERHASRLSMPKDDGEVDELIPMKSVDGKASSSSLGNNDEEGDDLEVGLNI
jgi:sulfate transporter 4